MNKPMELLSTSVMGGTPTSSGRSSGTPFRQNRMAAALSKNQMTRAIQRLGWRRICLIRDAGGLVIRSYLSQNMSACLRTHLNIKRIFTGNCSRIEFNYMLPVSFLHQSPYEARHQTRPSTGCAHLPPRRPYLRKPLRALVDQLNFIELYVHRS
jgi:hypothetical protein